MVGAARSVAILADVHGNLPALAAVLADVAARGIGEVVVAGDLVGFGASPNAVVDRLVAIGATLIRGNHETDYVNGYADPANRSAWRANPDLAGMCWYLDRLGAERAALLTGLPDRHWLDPATLVTHGSPRHNRDSVTAETTDDDLVAMFGADPPRLTFVGHTHVPLVRDVPWGRVVNVGSVGAALGDPRAVYAVAGKADGAADGDWAVEVARIPYDVEATIAAYDGGMGAADPIFVALLARQLRTGRPVFRDWARVRPTTAPADRPAALARLLAADDDRGEGGTAMTNGPAGSAITITARKYDGAAHLTWPARLLLADDDLLLAYTPPGLTLVHHTKGLRLPQEHACLSAFPRHRHWNAMLDFAPDGAPLGVYCNVALPPTLTGDRLDWVDLDLDVVRSGDGPAMLVDEDEFAAHAARYADPAALVATARAAADELLALAARGVAPFAAQDRDTALMRLAAQLRRDVLGAR